MLLLAQNLKCMKIKRENEKHYLISTFRSIRFRWGPLFFTLLFLCLITSWSDVFWSTILKTPQSKTATVQFIYTLNQSLLLFFQVFVLAWLLREMYLGPSQTFKVKFFGKMLNGLKQWTFFTKKLYLRCMAGFWIHLKMNINMNAI